MDNLKVIAVLLVIIGLAVTYVVRAKKRGVKCIGCSAGCTCKKVGDAGNFCRGCCGGVDSCGNIESVSEDH